MRDLGPITATQLEDALRHERPTVREGWGWNWSAVKSCLEYLFWAGEITSAGRTASFERRYAVPAAVLPPEVVAARDAARDADPQEAVTELLRLSTLDGTIVLDEAACTIRLTIPATVTEALTWRSGVYDLELVSLDGTVTRLLAGKIKVVDEVTT